MTSLGGIVNIFSEIKKYEEDTLFAGKAVEQMTKAFGNMNVDDAIKAFRGLGIEGEDLVEILLDCGVKSEVVEASLKKVGKTGTSFVGKLKDGFKGFAATLGMTAKQLGLLIGALAIPAALVAGWKIINNQIEKAVNNARSSGEVWDQENTALEADIVKLEEIDKKLKDHNLTEEESYQIKSDLYSMQKNITETYGVQAEGIDLVNGKIEEEIQLLKDLAVAEASAWLQDDGFGAKIEYDRVYKDKPTNIGTFSSLDPDSNWDKVIQPILDRHKGYFKSTEYDGQYYVSYAGDVADGVKILEAAMNDIIEADANFAKQPLLNEFYSQLQYLRNEFVGILTESGPTADRYIQSKIITDPKQYLFGKDSGSATEWIDKLSNSVKNYNDALLSGDQNEIRAAAEEYEHIHSVMDEFARGDMSDYADYIKVIESGLNTTAISANKFRQVMSGNNEAIGKDIAKFGRQLKSMGISDKDLEFMLFNSNNAEFGEYQFRQIIEAAKETGFIIGESEDDIRSVIDVLVELGYVSGEVSGSVGGAAKSYTSMVEKLSSVKSEFSAVAGAISEQGYNGNLSVDTYNSLIAISSDYSECIEYQNGALQLNAEKANMLLEAKNRLAIEETKLQKIVEATEWQENTKKIKEYESATKKLTVADLDELKSLKDRNAKIEDNLIGYDLQIAALEELTSAYGRWKAVSESDNSDSMYKGIRNAYEAIKDAQKTGQTGVGNVVYQAAVKLLVPEEEDVSKYMSTLKRYITDGSNGLNNFITDMVTEGLMTKTGDHVEMVAGTTIEEICQRMTITPDMAKAIFNALEMYDFDFNWTDEDFNINTDDAMAELKAAQEEMNNTIATINKMKEAGATVDFATGLSRDDLEKKLAEQKSQVDKLMNSATGGSGDNTVEYTVTANTEAADAALDTIKSKLDEIKAKIEELAQKIIGTFGASSTLSILGSVYDKLVNINNYKIADKSFTTYNYLETVGGSSDGSGETQQFASGTKSAPGGVALLGDEYSPDGSPKPELVITDGAAYVAGQSGPEFVNLNEGDRVIPADETEKILRGNPKAEHGVVPAFATGAGGYPAGSVQEDKYLEGAIGPDPTWLKEREEQKKKDDELIKQLSQKAAEKSADDTYLNYVASTGAAVKTSVSVGGGGDTSSLKNPGGSGGGGSGGGSSSSSSSDSSKNEKSQFEKDYELKNHYLNMEKMDYEEYIDWLEDAYKKAYEKGEIQLEDFYKYEEEVFEGQKELFQDSINDIEHKIKTLERNPGNEKQIINYYNQIISNIDKEIAAARARGLNDDDDYIQELLGQKWDYADEIKDIQDEITENAKDAVEDLVDYRMDMLKQDLENERDAIGDKLDTLRDFYDKQKEMLQDVYDEEKYLEEQSEKRKSVDDIKAEMDMLRFDDSAKAQKRLKELQEELKDAEKELADFEKDHALESATDLLDKMYEQQEAQMQSEIDALEEKLNDPNALYNQALRDIQNNTLALYEEMIKYNNKYGSGNPEDIFNMWSDADKSLEAYFKTMGESYKNILLVDAYKPTGYASGTSHATSGVHELFEGNKDEYVYTTKDGKRYRMFSGLGDKVLNASATDFLYKFANNGETFISNMLSGLVSAIGNVGKPAQQIQLSTGDVIIQGNATQETVSAIRRAQRENVDYILREFTRLNR